MRRREIGEDGKHEELMNEQSKNRSAERGWEEQYKEKQALASENGRAGEGMGRRGEIEVNSKRRRVDEGLIEKHKNKGDRGSWRNKKRRDRTGGKGGDIAESGKKRQNWKGG